MQKTRSDPLAVRGARLVTPEGVRPGIVLVRDGRIAAIAAYADLPTDVPTIEAGDAVVLPGLVDTHVHVNEPGRTDWEGFAHATRAAAAGGVTTIVDMPLNSIPATTSVEAFETKLRAATAQCCVDVAFWGGVVPGNSGELPGLAERGVAGFKCFLAPSGVDEFERVGEPELRAALPVLARLDRPLLVHAELPSLLRVPDSSADPVAHGTWLDSRPAAAEHAAIDLLIRLARESGAHVHIVHLASADAVDLISQARSGGVRITVETCPHYLTFAAREIPDRATAFKCAPPIRDRRHREGLWRALEGGRIDLVASDHSPAPPRLKHVETGDFVRAWGGIASLQLSLSAVWTGAHARGLPFERLAAWMSDAPARLAGLGPRKGAIAPGHDADLVIWDPDAEQTLEPAALLHRHPLTPYAGLRLRGVVLTTIVRGRVVYEDGRTVAPDGGMALRRDSARA